MIKFNKHHIAANGLKARVHYSVDNRIDGRPCVTLYAKDYNDSLCKIFKAEYKNDTDINTDYFDAGSVTLFADHPLYAEARQRAAV